MKILIIDNFDSFTYNLYHYLEEINSSIEVKRYDENLIESCKDYDKIVISPGPGLPEDYPALFKIIETYGQSKSILGICLGLQTIAQTFGHALQNIEDADHGQAKMTYLTKPVDPIFDQIPNEFLSARYHSWLVDREGIEDAFRITAVDESGHIMALSHHQYDVKGVQFHPESIMTPEGKQMLKNWVNQ